MHHSATRYTERLLSRVKLEKKNTKNQEKVGEERQYHCGSGVSELQTLESMTTSKTAERPLIEPGHAVCLHFKSFATRLCLRQLKNKQNMYFKSKDIVHADGHG